MNAKRAKTPKNQTTKLFVLDTNVLMHESTTSTCR